MPKPIGAPSRICSALTKSGQEVYLPCKGIDTTINPLDSHGITVERPPHDPGWGRLAIIRLPGGGRLGLPATPSAAGPRFGLARATPWKQLSRRIPPRFGKIF